MRTRKVPSPTGSPARDHSARPKDTGIPSGSEPHGNLGYRHFSPEIPKRLLKYDIWKTSTSPVDIPATSPTRSTEKVLLSMSLPESEDVSLSRCFLEQCRLDRQLESASTGSSEVSWISRWWSSTDNSNNTSLSTRETEDSSSEQVPVTSESGLACNSPSSWKQGLFKQQRSYVSALSAMLQKGVGPQQLCPLKHDIRSVIATARKVQPTLGKVARCSRHGERKVQSCPAPRMQQFLDEASLSPSSASLPREIPRSKNKRSPKETPRCAASEDESMDTSYTSAHSGPVTDSLCNSSSTPGLVSREEQKSILLGQLMDYFFAVLASGQENGNGAKPSQQTASSFAGAAAPSSSARSSARRGVSRKGKRLASPEDDSSDNEENEGPKTKKAKTEEAEVKRLACPFFKRDPHRYQHQGKCVGPGWTTVHRLKEHLYRRHRLPVHCLRCHEVFLNEQGLEQHSQSQVPCQRTAGAKTLEGITSSQERQLRSRKRSDRTEKEKWRDVYRICFPLKEDEDPTPIPNPYFELPTQAENGGPGQMARYDEYMARELPRRVKRALELRIEQEFSPVEESLKRQLPDIVRGLYQTLSEDFRRSLKASPSREEEAGEDQEHHAGAGLMNGVRDIKGKGKMVVASDTPEPTMEVETPDARSDCVVDETPVYGNWETGQPIELFRPLQPYYGGGLAGLDDWMCAIGQDSRDWSSWPDAGHLSGAISAASSGMAGDNGCSMFGNELFALQAPYTGDNGVYQDRFSLT